MKSAFLTLMITVSACSPVEAQHRSAKLLHAAGRGNVLVAAHRGGYSNDRLDRAPENSLANLKLAIQKRYDVYETDIQRTSDGVFVIVHDPTLVRETNGSGTVKDKTLAELKTLNKRYRDRTLSEERVVTLEELLEAGKGRILFKPDLKPGIINHFEELAHLITKLQMTDHVFLRTGFKDVKTIHALFDNGCPKVELMFKAKNAAQVRIAIQKFQPKTIQIDVAKGEKISDSKAAAIELAVRNGVLVETHIYQDSDQWQKLAKLGVRMFHTSTPDTAIQFLETNGWRKDLVTKINSAQ